MATSLCTGEGTRKIPKADLLLWFYIRSRVALGDRAHPWVRRWSMGGRRGGAGSQISAQKLPSLCVACKRRPVFLCSAAWSRHAAELTFKSPPCCICFNHKSHVLSWRWCALLSTIRSRCGLTWLTSVLIPAKRTTYLFF